MPAVPTPVRAPAPAGWQDVAAGWQDAVADDGTRLAWRADGPTRRGGPAATPLLLCNGIACDDGWWSRILGPLAAQRTVVRWDYRGHGRSAVPADPAQTTMDDVVGDLGTILAAAGITELVLVGHSFGVQVAVEGLRRGLVRAHGLVAIAGAAGRPLPAPVTASLPAVERLRRRFPRAAEHLWRQLWTGQRVVGIGRLAGGLAAATPGDVLETYVQHVHDLDLATLSGMFLAMQTHDASAAVDDLQIPILAIAGSRDGLARLEAVRDLALRAPDGELAVIHGAAHTLPVEEPQAVLGALLPFLDRLDRLATIRDRPPA